MLSKRFWEERKYNLKPVGDQRIVFKAKIKIITVNIFKTRKICFNANSLRVDTHLYSNYIGNSSANAKYNHFRKTTHYNLLP